jgi:hypothetical protein
MDVVTGGRRLPYGKLRACHAFVFVQQGVLIKEFLFQFISKNFQFCVLILCAI